MTTKTPAKKTRNKKKQVEGTSQLTGQQVVFTGAVEHMEVQPVDMHAECFGQTFIEQAPAAPRLSFAQRHADYVPRKAPDELVSNKRDELTVERLTNSYFGCRKNTQSWKNVQALSVRPRTMRELMEISGSTETFYNQMNRLTGLGRIKKNHQGFYLA